MKELIELAETLLKLTERENAALRKMMHGLIESFELYLRSPTEEAKTLIKETIDTLKEIIPK